MQLWTKALGIVVLVGGAAAITSAQQQQQPPAAGKGTTTNQPGNQKAPHFDAARFVKDHDKNGDGKLGKDELPQGAQDEFAQIDTNKDGSISPDELQQHADRMAAQRPQLVEVIFYAIDVPEEPVTTQELQSAYDQLRKLDKNSDGKIDDSELKMMREQRKKERTDHVFAALDRNKDGKIGKDEARGLWADNFAQLDKNNDGFIDHQEVEAACAAHAAAQPGQPGQPGKTGQPGK
jgi:Ca2+-binding EF-hand superfamily protein